MNQAKVNMKICRALASGKSVYGSPVDESDFFVTEDGRVGYILPREKMTCKIDKIRVMKQIIQSAEFDKSKYIPLIKSRIFINCGSGKGFCRMFKTNEYHVWLRTDFLDCFNEQAEYYHTIEGTDSGPAKMVTVVENDRIVGFVCPVRVYDSSITMDIESLRGDYIDLC